MLMSPEWTIVDFFALKFGDYRGRLTDIELSIENRTFKHFGWGFGVELFDFDLDATDDKLKGTFQTSLIGANPASCSYVV